MLPMHDIKKIICLAVDDEPPALDVMRKHITSTPTLHLAGCCSDAVDALGVLQQNEIDLMFLDIRMPQILGTDFLRTLRNPPKVIFTTAYRKFAVEGFELDAVDYLLKPVSFERFLKAVNKVIHVSPSHKNTENVQKAETPESSLYFRCDRKMVKVALQEILYIESIKDYIKIFTTSNMLVTKQSISTIEESLPKNLFLRIHRSYIISVDKIDSYSNELVWVAKTELPISRMYRHEVDKILKK
jgi:DNA-binding LytR/AlgR family response regulator